MSKIEELIKENCPNGVEFKRIIEIAEVGTGSSNRQDATEDGIYPFYVRSKEVFRINKYEYDEEAVIIPGEGGIGEIFHYVNGKYALHQRAYRIHLIDNIVNTKFLYYYMFNCFKDFIMKKAVSATVTSIRKPMIEQFSIPIPPIEIQEEIVRVLDQFSILELELKAELESRKSQYEFYRNKLLSKEYKKVKLQDILLIKNGKDYKHLESGNIPVYGSGGIMTYVNQYVYDKPSVLIPRKGSLGNVFSVDTPFWNVDTIYYTQIDDTKVIPKYIYYFIQNLHLDRLNIAGGVPSMTQGTLNKLEIMLPPMEKQKQIVKILDKFDKLVNDIKEGIPAEIEARRKQYEYYRNKLLSFEEVSYE